MLRRRAKAVYRWVLGTTVYSLAIIIVWALCLGVVSLVVEYFHRFFHYDMSFIESRAGVVVVLAIISSMYAQSNWPLDISEEGERQKNAEYKSTTPPQADGV
jgi:uncharacterized membrane protein